MEKGGEGEEDSLALAAPLATNLPLRRLGTLESEEAMIEGWESVRVVEPLPATAEGNLEAEHYCRRNLEAVHMLQE